MSVSDLKKTYFSLYTVIAIIAYKINVVNKNAKIRTKRIRG